jgi:site-specific recombinase XerD
MKTASTKREKCKPWRTSGGIRIRPLLNASGAYSYRAEIPESVTGTRLLRQFKTPDEAEAFAAVMLVQRQNSGLAAFTISDREREDARKALELLRASPGATLVQVATFFLKHHRPLGGDLSISELVAKFIAEKRLQNLRPRSLADLEHRLNVFTRTFGTNLVRDVDVDAIKKWLVADTTRSEQTKLNFRRVLHGFFSFAVKNKYAALNPVADIEIRVESEDPGILTVAQAHCLLLTALEKSELGLGPFVTLGLFCGLRSGELARLDWRDVNFSEGFVTISKRIAKKRRIRNVPLEPLAVAWLQTFGVRPSGRVAPVGLDKRFRKLIKAAGAKAAAARPPIAWFEKWPTNAMRHSFASYFFAKSSNAAETCARLGQRSDDVLFQHYRSLVKKTEAVRFFELAPPTTCLPLILPQATAA